MLISETKRPDLIDHGPLSQVQPMAVGTLSWGQALLTVAIVAVAVLLAGLLVIYGRRRLSPTDSPGSLVRSWIAIALVLGLILFSAFAFAVDDASLRSTLIGGLAASVGSAVAFYFSAKSSDQARQDLLNATVGTELVPDLLGMSDVDATTTLGKTSFKLEIDPTSPPSPATTIDRQSPAAGTASPKGSSVTVHFR